MRRSPLLLLLLLAVVSIQQAGCAHPRADRTGKVVLLVFDGLSADGLQSRLDSGDLSGAVSTMQREGLHIRRVIPVEPSLTAPTFISLITGADPQVTGIVSNTIQRPGDPPLRTVSGFSAEIDAETLVEAARRQGRTVGVITYPGIDWLNRRRSADWGLVYNEPVARSGITRLNFRAMRTIERDDLPSFSPIRHDTIAWSFPVGEGTAENEVLVFVLDTTDDDVENYDTLRLEFEGRPLTADDRGWFAVSRRLEEAGEARLFGSWWKTMTVEPDHAVIYAGPTSRTIGHPRRYRQMIDEQIGFWPGPPDNFRAGDWMEGRDGIDPQTFTEQLERFSRFFTDATLLSMKTMPYDLLLSYQPIIDVAEHQYLLVSPEQNNFAPGNVRLAASVIDAAWRTFDQAATQIVDAAGAETTLVITGDHGMASLDTLHRLNRQLVEWGFATSGGNRLSPETQWWAVTSGNLAHLYGRGRSEEETLQLIERLRQLQAPDGRQVFEQVRRRTTDDHPNSGEIIAFAYPAFTFSSSLAGELFEKTSWYGTHGALSHHPELHTTLLAIGPRIEPEVRESAAQTELARWFSSLLGMQPPRNAE
jgi:predicted AlkP superfamily pyrophosphatase or phosphodiesterase